MKYHGWWWVAAGAVILMLLAVMMDRPGSIIDRWLGVTATPDSLAEVQPGLRACEGSSASFLGPLVPGQTTASTDHVIVENAPDGPDSIISRSYRAGFGISSATDPEHWAQLLGSGWYIDWRMQNKASGANLIHWQMVRVHEDCVTPSPDAIQAAAAGYPGQVWIIGNEPDVIWQDNVTAPRYAVVYHDLYGLIQASDPTALIAVGGISQATRLRLAYLDQVLQTYQDLYQASMPVDWWTLHGYVLREEKGSWGVDIPPGIDATQGELREVSDHGRMDLFENQLRSFRQWMAQNGYQNTPLALTEYGILMPASYGFPPEAVADYLEQTFTWLSLEMDPSTGYPQDGYRLVQKWAWFSVSDPTYSSSNLGDLSSGNLTLVGERFRDNVYLTVP